MKIISWNVNGVRSSSKSVINLIESEKPDVLCVQETKSNNHSLLLSDYHQFWNDAEKKGYSGTAVFSKVKPLRVKYGINIEEHDKEGRVIVLEFENFFLVNVYVPNAQRGLTRLKYRLKWDSDFLSFLKSLKNKKGVLICGDLNVAHTEIDLANPKQNEKNAGFTIEERKDFTKLLNSGFADAFRLFNKNSGQYSWWTYRFNARKRNIGWRIDYFLASDTIKIKIKECKILTDFLGSDHAPVLLNIEP